MLHTFLEEVVNILQQQEEPDGSVDILEDRCYKVSFLEMVAPLDKALLWVTEMDRNSRSIHFMQHV